MRDTIQIAVLPLHLDTAVIELRQVDDILHKLRHTGGFNAYLARERSYVVLLHQTVLYKLGIAGNSVKRGFQLMRYISGKLLPYQCHFFYLLLVFFQLVLLYRNMPQKGLDFLVVFLAVILFGLVEVYLVDRLHDLLCKSRSQQE